MVLLACLACMESVIAFLQVDSLSGFLVLQPYGFVFAGIAFFRDADGVFTRFWQTDADALFCFNADGREERVASAVAGSIDLSILAGHPFHTVASQVEV